MIFSLIYQLLRSILLKFKIYADFMTKKGRLYNGEKTVSSMSGAGKIGQLHVKE